MSVKIFLKVFIELQALNLGYYLKQYTNQIFMLHIQLKYKY